MCVLSFPLLPSPSHSNSHILVDFTEPPNLVSFPSNPILWVVLFLLISFFITSEYVFSACSIMDFWFSLKDISKPHDGLLLEALRETECSHVWWHRLHNTRQLEGRRIRVAISGLPRLQSEYKALLDNLMRPNIKIIQPLSIMSNP